MVSRNKTLVVLFVVVSIVSALLFIAWLPNTKQILTGLTMFMIYALYMSVGLLFLLFLINAYLYKNKSQTKYKLIKGNRSVESMLLYLYDKHPIAIINIQIIVDASYNSTIYKSNTEALIVMKDQTNEYRYQFESLSKPDEIENIDWNGKSIASHPLLKIPLRKKLIDEILREL